MKRQANKKQSKNDPFGDNLRNKITDSIRFLIQNVNELELSTTCHTLEETCNSIKKFNIDITCLAETNTNWNNPKAKTQIYKITKQFWNRSKLIIAISSVSLNKLHKLGGIAILFTPLITLKIIQEHQDTTGMERWASITINGRNKKKSP